jgi:SAM-dependent methyltransferase
MRDWLSFWNAPNRIYVNDRHRDVHYRDIALGIRALVPSPSATVLDYGCGEATAAQLVAGVCGRLILSDAAEGVREKLAQRFEENPKISVRSPEEIAALPDGGIDLVVINSVAQYLDRAAFARLLALFRRLLASDGRLVIGDVIPPHTSALTEIAALVNFAWRNGFVMAAMAGMARTAFSDYGALRTRLGLTHYSEAEMLSLLAQSGFTARRHYPNLEHNQERMTFVATPDAAARADSVAASDAPPDKAAAGPVQAAATLMAPQRNQ